MSQYKITSSAGMMLGYYPGDAPIDALDGLARRAGYRDHAHCCAEREVRADDWTSSRAAFRRGNVALLVLALGPS